MDEAVREDVFGDKLKLENVESNTVFGYNLREDREGNLRILPASKYKNVKI